MKYVLSLLCVTFLGWVTLGAVIYLNGLHVFQDQEFVGIFVGMLVFSILATLAMPKDAI